MKTKTKKIISSILIAANIAIPANITLAKTESRTHQEVKVYFNEEKIEFDQEPIIVDGRTKVPFRAIFETMGTVVYHRAKDNSILAITRDGDAIYHVIGTNKATKNGKEFTFDSTSELKNDRTLIPVRMVADLLNAKVEWDGNTSEVDITKEIETNEYHKKIRGILGCSIDKNFNPEDFKRYVSYQYKHWDMDPKQVIIDVNMDLDKDLVETKQYMNEVYHTYYVAKDEDIEIVNNPDSPLVLLNKFNKLPNDYHNINYFHNGPAYNFDGPLPYDESLGNNYLLHWAYKFVDNEMVSAGYAKNYLIKDYFEMRKDAIKAGCVNETLSDRSAYRVPSEAHFDFDFCYNIRQIINELTTDPYIQNGPIIGEYNCELSTGNLLMICDLDDVVYTVMRYLLSNGYYEEASKHSSYEWYIKDINENNRGYAAEIKTYAWLEENSYKYGFIPRYPRDKENITRYQYLPEYYKYVGKDVAKIIHDNNWCFEEYYARHLNPTEYKTDLNSTKEKVLSRY